MAIRPYLNPSGEVCASRDRRFLRKNRNRFTRLTKYRSHPPAVQVCQFLLRETQSQQQLMGPSVAHLYGDTPNKHSRGDACLARSRRLERGKECGDVISSGEAMNPTGGASSRRVMRDLAPPDPLLLAYGVSRDNMLSAWYQVKASKKAPGIDCITVGEFPEHAQAGHERP